MKTILTTNTPYVKQFGKNESGETIVINPIGEKEPYLHNSDISRQERRGNLKREYISIPYKTADGKTETYLQTIFKRKSANGKWVKA